MNSGCPERLPSFFRSPEFRDVLLVQFGPFTPNPIGSEVFATSVRAASVCLHSRHLGFEEAVHTHLAVESFPN